VDQALHRPSDLCWTILLLPPVITNVPTRVEKADANAFQRVLGLSPRSGRPESFVDQIAMIREIQEKILKAVPVDKGIPQFEIP